MVRKIRYHGIEHAGMRRNGDSARHLYGQLIMALTNQQPVAPSLKQRFGDWIDARTAQGIETYGVPLMHR